MFYCALPTSDIQVCLYVIVTLDGGSLDLEVNRGENSVVAHFS